ncbi:methyl-accepting chemotaxis protein [Dechloromonas sp. HYN0024]|uniref:methyl-accepting chemotaxis protein n=1 Tax=Dechloromonas sp. HYN0024 TaxID=2231055 RepID=UPI0013C2C6F2|nr:methyl-accepting chemotaxis protein [Dechloromonas sp. HYN0024]
MTTKKLANKFIGLGLVAAIALAVPIVPLVKGFNSQIAIAEKERVGVVVHGELRKMLQEVQRHRGASTALLAGKQTFKERADRAMSGADAAMGGADVALANAEASIGKARQWAEFKRGWQTLKGGYATLSPQENARQHTALIAILLDVMDSVAEQSELVLDPEVVTYYAMDMNIIQLPPLTERMGQARALGSLVLSDKLLDSKRRDSLIEGLAEAQIRQKSVLADSEKIYAADESNRARLAGAVAPAIAGMATFIGNIQKNLLDAETLSYDPGRYFDEATQSIDASFRLYDEGTRFLDQELMQRIARIERERLLVLVLVFALVAVAAIVAFVMLRSVHRSVVSVSNALDRIAAGELDVQLRAETNDEIGQMVHCLEDMQSQLRGRLEADRLAANETMRLKVALDVTSNSVMVADPEGTIIYCNAALLGMMRNAENDLRQDLPNFRVDTMLGANFDIYHRQPAHQRNLLAGLKGTHRARLQIGGRDFTLIASPVINAAGERLGTVVEWQDRTDEVAIEREVATIIEAAANGDFSQRLDSSGMDGFFRQVSEGVNKLLAASTDALDDVGAMLARMAKGDLTQKIETPYQGILGRLKDDANVTVDNLQEMLLSIKDATDSINTAAKEIASGNLELSRRTEEQASSLQETASSMEELTGTVKQNADNSRQASELAGSAQQVAIKGGEVVGQVVQTMTAIHQSSNRIADIIGVIDGIAFQTNILALNAAVEAARAGEQGRGFAVVASEVRNLAQRSAAAAKEIKGLISDSVDKVEAGSKLVDQAGRTMDEVVSSIRRVAGLMVGISDASREQSAGIEQVSIAVSQMDEVTQQNAALVEQAAAAAESLEEQAGNLALSVAVFRLSGGVVVSGEQNLRGLDIDGAISAHRGWKQHLTDYVAGGGAQLDPVIVGRDDVCALGCWIHGDGRVLNGHPGYGDLKTEHAGFHRCAAEIIRTAKSGDTDRARREIAGEFSARSQRVIGLLENLRSTDDIAMSRQLTGTPGRKQPSVSVLALSGPTEDEWEEF